MPAEVKNFIADLEKKAKEHPDDVAAWMRLGQVNARAAQLDPSYSSAAASAFQHILEREPKNIDALRGIANVHYDRNEHREAIPFYEQYLALKPDDLSAQTDLGTMYLAASNPTRAIAIYRDVLRQNPSFMQAHYNLAVAYHRQGDDPGALGELQTARALATDDDVRRQIDDMIAGLKGGPPPPAAGTPVEAPPADRSPFQAAVEAAFRNHPIMGPRIARFDWTGPATGRVLVRDFPMAAMPDNVREKFTGRLGGELRSAQSSHPVEGAVSVEIADASSGAVMATIRP
jgi:tetratricopeptide (TPR) repeat protein